MTGYTFDVTCPKCGGPVIPVVEGRVVAGTETSAVFRCAEPCTSRYAEWQVVLFLRPVADRHQTLSCGTVDGLTRHKRLGEPPCPACLDARARNRNPEGVDRHREPDWELARKQRRRELAEVDA